jgi:hypothetical protein
VIESLKEPCRKCGEDRLYLIQFHHVNPKDKKFQISLCGSRSEATIRKEISKCVCLCSNCHDEFHHFYGKNPKNPVESLMEYLGEGKPYNIIYIIYFLYRTTTSLHCNDNVDYIRKYNIASLLPNL